MSIGSFATKKPSLIVPPKGLSAVGYVCLIVFGLVVLALLQHQYWQGENGRANLNELKAQIAEQTKVNEEQIYANNLLKADVHDLKTQTSAIEEHARLDLGLIKSGETFFQMSNAPVTYSRQIQTDEESDAVEPVEGLEADGDKSQ